jgi:hypothetical protein
LLRHAGTITHDQPPHQAFGEELESGHDERGGRETRPPRGQRDHRDDRPDGEDAEELDGVGSEGEAVREPVDPREHRALGGGNPAIRHQRAQPEQREPADGHGRVEAPPDERRGAHRTDHIDARDRLRKEAGVANPTPGVDFGA